MIKKNKTPKNIRLHTKASINFILLTILISAILVSALYLNFKTQSKEDFRKRLYDIVAVTSLNIDGDAHNKLKTADDEGNITYQQIKQNLQNIKGAGTDIYYVYTMRQNDEGRIIFLVDAETNPDEIAHLGSVYLDASEMLMANFSTLDKPFVEKSFYTDRWGTWLSGYAPFYTSDNKKAGVLGIDIDASSIIEREQYFLRIALSIFVIILFLVGILGWLFGRRLAAPFISFTAGIKRIAEGDLDHKIPSQKIYEFKMFAEDFNSMIQKLKKSLGDLQNEIILRKKTEDELVKHRDNLEELVEKRTSELQKSEEKLKKYSNHLEELVKERTKVLEKKTAELEHFYELTVGREFRIKELRDKVKELEKKH